MEPARLVDLLNRALRDILRRTPEAFLLGEDLLDPYGGAFKVTRGLSTAFPGQVIPTPICENGIVGFATGAALRGMRPIVEIMFGDFLPIAADQIINHLAKVPTMFGRDITTPVVIRAPVGGGRGYGPTHSQSLESIFMGVPNLKVIALNLFTNPVLLLEGAFALAQPVLFVEHKSLYPLRLLAEGVALDLPPEHVGLPVASYPDMPNDAADVIVLTYGGLSRFAPEVCRDLHQEEVTVKFICPALLNEGLGTVGRALQGARRVLIAEEGVESFGWSAEMASLVRDALPRATVARLGSKRSVIPASREQEDLIIPTRPALQEAIVKLLHDDPA